MPAKPVVFIPGFIASQLLQRSKNNRVIYPPSVGDLLDKDRKKRLVRLLSGPDEPPGDIVAGEPVRGILNISKQAESLYDILRTYNYSTAAPDQFFAPVGWDWRLAVDHHLVLEASSSAIRRLADANGSRVVVFIHSTGGLVFRRLLELRPDLAERIEHVFAFGIPWAGAPKSIRFLAKGEKFGFLTASLTAADVREIMSHSQAAYDLFPPDPAKSDLTTAAGKRLDLFVNASGKQVGPLVDLSWIPSGPSKDYMRVMASDADARLGRRSSESTMPPVTNVVGWGVETDTQCVLDDGKIEIVTSDEGDNTVPTVSAAWLRGTGVRTFFLPVGVYPTAGVPSRHVRIWDSPPVLELFDQVLLGKAPEPWVCAAADSDQSLDRRSDVTLRIAAQDEQGRALPNARATFRNITGRAPVDLKGSPRANVIVKRTGLKPNAAPDLCRFVIEVTWGDGGPSRRREIPVVVRV